MREEPASLEAKLLCAWEDLASRGRAECLVCGGELVAAAADEASGAGGECRECHASLA